MGTTLVSSTPLLIWNVDCTRGYLRCHLAGTRPDHLDPRRVRGRWEDGGPARRCIGAPVVSRRFLSASAVYQ
jgi:hypothetical protein